MNCSEFTYLLTYTSYYSIVLQSLPAQLKLDYFQKILFNVLQKPYFVTTRASTELFSQNLLG